MRRRGVLRRLTFLRTHVLPVALGSLAAFAVGGVVVLALHLTNRASPSPSPSRAPSAHPSPTTAPSPGRRHIWTLRDLRPVIEQTPIPFGRRRRAQMARYSKRHYGFATAVLRRPRVIVEHTTGGTSLEGALETFRSDAPHLGETPGVCVHFLVDTNGLISQLVPLSLRCRHTIGLNWTAVGIAAVGESAQTILRTPPERSALVRLTLWLARRFHIAMQNVIGSNEAPRDWFFKEAYPKLRCRGSSGWARRDAVRLRRLLLAAARARRISLPNERGGLGGPRPNPNHLPRCGRNGTKRTGAAPG